MHISPMNTRATGRTCIEQIGITGAEATIAVFDAGYIFTNWFK